MISEKNTIYEGNSKSPSFGGVGGGLFVKPLRYLKIS